MLCAAGRVSTILFYVCESSRSLISYSVCATALVSFLSQLASDMSSPTATTSSLPIGQQQTDYIKSEAHIAHPGGEFDTFYSHSRRTNALRPASLQTQQYIRNRSHTPYLLRSAPCNQIKFSGVKIVSFGRQPAQVHNSKCARWDFSEQAN